MTHLMSPVTGRLPERHALLPATQRPSALSGGGAVLPPLFSGRRPHFSGDKTGNAAAKDSHGHHHAPSDRFDASAPAAQASLQVHQHEHHHHGHTPQHAHAEHAPIEPPKGIVDFFVQFFKRLIANLSMVFPGRSPEAAPHEHHHHAHDEPCDHPHHHDHAHSHETGTRAWLKDFYRILSEDFQSLLKNDDDAPHSHSHGT